MLQGQNPFENFKINYMKNKPPILITRTTFLKDAILGSMGLLVGSSIFNSCSKDIDAKIAGNNPFNAKTGTGTNRVAYVVMENIKIDYDKKFERRFHTDKVIKGNIRKIVRVKTGSSPLYQNTKFTEINTIENSIKGIQSFKQYIPSEKKQYEMLIWSSSNHQIAFPASFDDKIHPSLNYILVTEDDLLNHVSHKLKTSYNKLLINLKS